MKITVFIGGAAEPMSLPLRQSMVERKPSKARAERILAEAARLFADTGYAGTRMTDIAAAIGVTKPIIYRHFASKEALFEAWVEQSLGHKADVAVDWIRKTADNLPTVLATSLEVGQRLRESREALCVCRIAIGEADRFPELAAHVRDRLVLPILTALTEAFARAQAAGAVKPAAQPSLLAELFVAPIISMSILRASFGEQLAGYNVGDQVARAHLEGFKAAWLT